MNDLEKLKNELPNHISILRNFYYKSLEKIPTNKPNTNPYYEAVRYSNDIKKQIDTNIYVAKKLGVDCELQNKAVGASIRSN